MTQKKPLINCDIGELEHVDNNLFLPFADFVNICCGEYASNPKIINRAIRDSLKAGVKIGAHPGYPDRENFGRVSMDFKGLDFAESMFEQILYIKLLVEREGQTLHHVKAHGALYHDIMNDADLCSDFCKVIEHIDSNLKVIIPANNSSKDIFSKNKIAVLEEAFIDRRYKSKTQLLSRTKDGAVLSIEEIGLHLKALLKGQLETTEQGLIKGFEYLTLCIHSDSPNAVQAIELASSMIQDHV